MTVTFGFAVVMAFAFMAVTIWIIKFIAEGPPPDPDHADIREVDVPYVCIVCGMSLTITQAHDGDLPPPRHCREDMLEA